jgi:hypothetical protein
MSTGLLILLPPLLISLPPLLISLPPLLISLQFLLFLQLNTTTAFSKTNIFTSATLYVCTYVYMYVGMNECLYVCMYPWMYVWMNECINV